MYSKAANSKNSRGKHQKHLPPSCGAEFEVSATLLKTTNKFTHPTQNLATTIFYDAPL
jgi:hypothetical protein